MATITLTVGPPDNCWVCRNTMTSHERKTIFNVVWEIDLPAEADRDQMVDWTSRSPTWVESWP